jgi:hypothetical protein
LLRRDGNARLRVPQPNSVCGARGRLAISNCKLADGLQGDTRGRSWCAVPI